MITLYDYQERAVETLFSRFVASTKELNTQVLSICPGGGKTYSSIALANKLISASKVKKVLVLTHATKVLKDQWSQTFTQLGLKYSYGMDNFNDESVQFHIDIPQSLHRKDLKQFDLVIVDEAHEFYFAKSETGLGMVQKILKLVTPKYVLCLTGTPSIFIREGFVPVVIAGTDVYAGGYLSNVSIGLVRSKYNIKSDDYSSKTNEITTGLEIDENETRESLENVILEMMKHLKNPLVNSYNASNLLGSVGVGAAGVFSSLKKTLISCRNINQANQIHEILNSMKVNSVMSTSENDLDSESILAFKNDTRISVLLVVRRGILGFDMPELINVVDFSGTRNIDRIYQLYARVLRKDKKGSQKYFFRVISNINPSVDSFYTQAALALNDPNIISTYNGKNLRSLEILKPTRPNDTEESVEARESIPRDRSGDREKVFIFSEEDFQNILSLELLSEVRINSDSDYWKVVEYARFGDVIDKLRDGGTILSTASIDLKIKTILANDKMDFSKLLLANNQSYAPWSRREAAASKTLVEHVMRNLTNGVNKFSEAELELVEKVPELRIFNDKEWRDASKYFSLKSRFSMNGGNKSAVGLAVENTFLKRFSELKLSDLQFSPEINVNFEAFGNLLVTKLRDVLFVKDYGVKIEKNETFRSLSARLQELIYAETNFKFELDLIEALIHPGSYLFNHINFEDSRWATGSQSQEMRQRRGYIESMSSITMKSMLESFSKFKGPREVINHINEYIDFNEKEQSINFYSGDGLAKTEKLMKAELELIRLVHGFNYLMGDLKSYEMEDRLSSHSATNEILNFVDINPGWKFLTSLATLRRYSDTRKEKRAFLDD